jgi:formylglycine-generating enzyme required for sulfatase activity
MGSDLHYPEESPRHVVNVDGFWMEPVPVTNEQFGLFVEQTEYLTIAERPLLPEDYPGVPADRLVSGSAAFRPPGHRVDLRGPATWWEYVEGACWCRPDGPGSSIEHRGDHPVVHVSFVDALAYARWAGKSLPTEAQWERAARGGLDGAEFCWGDDFAVAGRVMANVWDGVFPWDNQKAHRPGTEPVGSYPANGYGLFDMAGNVWEWTTDFFQPGFGLTEPGAGDSCCILNNPTGPRSALSDPAAPEIPLRTLKGGSFLCAENYCMRYRPAARIAQASDSGSVHIGFRCIVLPDPGTAAIDQLLLHESA